MKALVFTITIAGSLAFAQTGTETRLPVNQQKPPKTVDEGTETGLKDTQRNDLKKWAYNSIVALRNLKRETANKPKPEAKKALMDGFRAISEAAEGKLNELLMRYTLNKAIDVVTSLENGMKSDYRFLDDAAVRVLTGLIQIAEDFYDSDVKLADKLMNGGDYEPPHMKYSIAVATLLNTYIESVPDIATQYNLYHKMLGYFVADMARSTKGKVIAPIAYPLDQFLHAGGLPEFVTYDRVLAKKGRDFLPLRFWVELPDWHKGLREMRGKFLLYYDLAVRAYELNKPI